MIVGMLWFDNNKERTPEEKIERVAKYYREKHKQEPDVCYVHHSMYTSLNGTPSRKVHVRVGDSDDSDIEIRTANTVLLHHFWIGQKNDKEIQ